MKTMNTTMTRTALLSAVVLFGMNANAAPLLPLQPGYAVHTFGASPDTADDQAVIRIYDTTRRNYDSNRPGGDFNKTYTHDQWKLSKIGNVYGVTIDNKRNIFVSASANWSSGYVGRGNTNGNVNVTYGSMENGGDNNDSAGRVYKLDANTGDVSVFAQLPQQTLSITSQVCEGVEHDVHRITGPGLGNIVYDKFHNQFFVSNFSDGKIYRLDLNGSPIGDGFSTGYFGAINGKTIKAPYGLAISPDGKHLFYGTMETNYSPHLYAIKLNSDGTLSGSSKDQHATLTDDVLYTQNIGGETVNDGVWAAYSDLEFTPDGELMVGVRVGCKGNFATSYNHGGVVYLLAKGDGGKYNKPSTKTPGTNTSQPDTPTGTEDKESRAGWYSTGHYNYDAGAIPLHPHYEGRLDEESLKKGPDDGYGGVAVWQTGQGDYDLYATSADIMSEEGLHGFMQFSGNFSISEDTATLEKAKGYKSVASSAVDGEQDNPHDYKGIGGDVEVLSVIPVSIGSYVWEDTDKDGHQSESESCIDGANVSLFHRENNGTFAAAQHIDGSSVDPQATGANGTCGSYRFASLPEGDYKVCVVPPLSQGELYVATETQTVGDNNNAEGDSNIATGSYQNNTYCSGMFSLYANILPKESGNEVGDNLDDGSNNDFKDQLGNMTVDFGFNKRIFDLALIKTIVGSAGKEYKPGDKVTFDIKVINQGNVDATDVEVIDYFEQFDGKLEFIANDNPNWTDNGTSATYAGDLNVAAGQSETIQITFKIKPGTKTQDLVNVAEIESANNEYGMGDRDSEAGDKVCYDDNYDLSHDNDTANTSGCDDLDPAVVHVVYVNNLPDNHESDPDSSSNGEDCDCNNVSQNKVDALGTLTMLLMLLGTLALSARFLGRDERYTA